MIPDVRKVYPDLSRKLKKTLRRVMINATQLSASTFASLRIPTVGAQGLDLAPAKLLRSFR